MKTVKLKKFLLIILLISTSTFSWAQGNLQYVDEKPLHFGFLLGINAMDFGITPSLQTIDGKIYQVDVSTLKPGFSVGIVSDLRLNRYLNLRFTPTLHFGERKLNYSHTSGTSDSLTISSVPVYMPLLLKYSAERKGNYRPYLLWGAGAYIDLGTNKDNPVLLKPLDFYTEFGVGCDLYFSFFKLAPELKFAIGFNDLLIPLDKRDAGLITPENRKFTDALSKLTSRMLTLTFNFE